MPNLISPGDLVTGYLIDDYYRYYLKFYKVRKTNLIQLDHGLRISKASDSDYLYYRLETTSLKELSIIRLQEIKVLDEKYYIVDKSHSFEKGNGYAIPIYEYAFSYLKYPVISDKTQTKAGSSNLWKKFQLRQVNANYEINILNTNTQHIGLYESRNYNDYDIWGLPQRQIDLYNINGDILSPENALGLNELEYSENLYEFEIEDDEDFLFNELPPMHPKLKEFIINGKKKIKDREHIRLIGQAK